MDYHGYQNDANDYFKLVLPSAGAIAVDLTNTSSTNTQLQLFFQVVSPGSLVAQAGGIPYSLSHSGPAGAYYVRVFTGAGYNGATPYTLRATFP